MEGWNVSRKGDSTTSLDGLFQCSATLSLKFFLTLTSNSLCFGLWPSLPALSLGATAKGVAPSSWHPPLRYLHVLRKSKAVQSFILQASRVYHNIPFFSTTSRSIEPRSPLASA